MLYELSLHFLENECLIQCNIKLRYNHIYKGTCDSCLNGTLHIQNEFCGKRLICVIFTKNNILIFAFVSF